MKSTPWWFRMASVLVLMASGRVTTSVHLSKILPVVLSDTALIADVNVGIIVACDDDVAGSCVGCVNSTTVANLSLRFAGTDTAEVEAVVAVVAVVGTLRQLLLFI